MFTDKSPAEAVGELVQGGGEMAWYVPNHMFGGAPEEDHHRERIATMLKEVHQRPLMASVDLTQLSADAVAFHRIGHSPAGRKPDLNGDARPHLIPRNGTVYEAHGAHGQRMGVRAGPVEERPDQTFLLQAKGPRESMRMPIRGHTRSGLTCQACCDSPKGAYGLSCGGD